MTEIQPEQTQQGVGERMGKQFDEFTRTILGALVIAVVIRMFFFEPFNIPSTSMVPGLLVGDYLFVSKYSYGYSSLSAGFGIVPVPGKLFARQPERGDVAVFKLPADPRTDYIKRVIGLPGDRIQMRHGLLYINGTPVERERLPSLSETRDPKTKAYAVDYIETLPNGYKHIIREEGDDMDLDNTETFVVPEGHYFMMGDNRDNSRDSRTDLVGFVPAANLVGKAQVVFFSIDEKTRFWEIWKWPSGVRWDRVFKAIK